MDPKLKGRGKIQAHASKGLPDAHASDFDVAWVSGLRFRNSTAIAAVCITPHGKSAQTNGLHLSIDAARQLADELDLAAKAGGSVDVTNHADGLPQVWRRISDVDAIVLATRISNAAKV